MSISRKESIINDFLSNKFMYLSDIANNNQCSEQYVAGLLRINGILTHRIQPYSKKINGSESELLVMKKLKEHHIKAKLMPVNYEYDIETESGLKIEVKHRSFKKSKYVKLHLTHHDIIDILIVICGSLKDPTFYIFKKGEFKKHLSIPLHPIFKTKNVKTKNKWIKIKQPQ